MVDVLEPYVKEIADLKKELPNILRKILIRRRDEVIKILKDEQLGKGLDSFGEKLIHPTKRNSPERWAKYEPVTEYFYAKQDPKPRTPKITNAIYDFEWTGGFKDGLDLMFEDWKSYSLFSKDSKAIFLEEQYGEITTLTKANNERVNQEILRPEMYDEIIKRLFI